MMFRINRHAALRKNLSPYLDGRLTPREAAGLEAHLQDCASCTRELEELRLMVAALGALPQAEVPRSFGLTPEQAGGPVRAPSPAHSLPLAAAGLRLATAGLAVALAAVVVLDVSSGGERESSARVQSAADEQEAAGAADRALTPGTEGYAGAGPAGDMTATTVPSPAPGGGTTGEDATAPGQPPATGALAGAPNPAATPTPTPAQEAAIQMTNGLAAETPSALAGVEAEEEPGGGVNVLLIAEIALAAALALAVAASLGLALAGRRRRP